MECEESRDWDRSLCNVEQKWAQQHFLWTTKGPDSLNPPFEVDSRAAQTRLTSSVSCRRPRIRSQVHCVFHDPRQRCVPCSSTAFRRRTQAQPVEATLEAPAMEAPAMNRPASAWWASQPSLTSFSMFFFEAVHHYRNITTNGRRGARAVRRGVLFRFRWSRQFVPVSAQQRGGISWTITCSCTAEFPIVFRVISPVTICSWWTWLYTTLRWCCVLELFFQS